MHYSPNIHKKRRPGPIDGRHFRKESLNTFTMKKIEQNSESLNIESD